MLYHLKKCDEAGFLCGSEFFHDSANVEGLHFRGHEFLANIRKPKIWDGTKKVAEKLGTSSLQSLTMVSANIATTLIKSHFGLT